MRLSLVIFFCLFVAVVHSAAINKAPAQRSAYSYLRSIRGKNSCSNGTCPFWERHGRSFVSLRCAQQEYQDCVCLHRMCYKSCLFTPQECNAEMVSCLQQICPRCLPASSLASCPASNAIATSVTNALSNFACYSCCPLRPNSINNTITIAPPAGNRVTRPGNAAAPGSVRPSNSNTGSVNGVNRPANANPSSVNGVGRPPNSNTGSTNGANRPVNGNTGSGNSANRPANGNTGSGNSANRPANGNTGNRPANVNVGSANGGNNGLQQPSNGNQRVPKKGKTTPRPATTKSKPAGIRTTKRAQKQS